MTEYLPDDNDAWLDAWNDGALDALRGKPRASSGAPYAEGYDHGLSERRVRVVMPARPEGYYHSPIGTFD
jgi:hypothetical protein